MVMQSYMRRRLRRPRGESKLDSLRSTPAVRAKKQYKGGTGQYRLGPGAVRWYAAWRWEVSQPRRVQDKSL